MPFKPLTAAQLRRAAASDDGAHRVAELLLEQQLPANTARTALLEGLCSSLTRRVRHTNGAHLVSNMFLRLLATMPLRLLVILLRRLLLLFQSTAAPAMPLLHASGRSASGKPATTSLMHTMARVSSENWISCHVRSADICGLREFYLLFSPAITNLCHFHPRRRPPENSVLDGNTRFAPGTLVLFEGKPTFPHVQHDESTPPATTQGEATIAARRGPHGFTHATERIPLFEGPCPWLHLPMMLCQPSEPLTQRNLGSMPF